MATHVSSVAGNSLKFQTTSERSETHDFGSNIMLAVQNFDNEMKTNRWFAKYETGPDRFGEQVNRIEFQGFDRLEDA
jgi:hypothetical protein